MTYSGISLARRARVEDASEIVLIAGTCRTSFSTGSTGEHVASVDPESLRNHLIAEDREGTIVGFSALGPSRDADANLKTAEVLEISVHPKQWRRRTGRALLSASLNRKKGISPIIELSEPSRIGMRHASHRRADSEGLEELRLSV